MIHGLVRCERSCDDVQGGVIAFLLVVLEGFAICPKCNRAVRVTRAGQYRRHFRFKKRVVAECDSEAKQ